MDSFYADLHIHTGISESGKWVKIPTSRQLTVRNTLEAACRQKGLDIVGLVDVLSPLVQQDIKTLLSEGVLQPLQGGGYRYKDCLTVLLGAEVETCERGGGLAHTLLFLPELIAMEQLSQRLRGFIKNIQLSSQNAHMPFSELVAMGREANAAIIPAHVFTPHKSLYGVCTRRIADVLSASLQEYVRAIELGLSADTLLADRIDELSDYAFLTNSDAHSLDKIAREYNVLQLERPDYAEVLKALAHEHGRCIKANYGLDPKLGKYHHSFCTNCQAVIVAGAESCPACGSHKLVTGVYERIAAIADYDLPQHPNCRPPYYYQVPLQFIPGIGKKTLAKLIGAFGTEMYILHRAAAVDIAAVAGDKIADFILRARSGNILIASGGGGIYGRVATK